MSDAPTSAPNAETEAAALAVPWSVVWVTLIVSAAIGIVFFLFFVVTRNKHRDQGTMDLYEKRLVTRSSRSPVAFAGNSWYGWALEAYWLDDDEALRCMGLDCFMFTRLLRLGFRISTFGTVCGVILCVVYLTGDATGAGTEQFNVITISSVEQSSPRLWATALLFAGFVAFTLRSLYVEWRDVYSPRRSQFLAKGDDDTPTDYRYSIILENIPEALRTNTKLHEHLNMLFPNQVRSAYVVQDTKALELLIQERQAKIEALEKAVAFTHAKPNKPKPQVKPDAKLMGLVGGQKVDAISFFTSEIERLNADIDKKRSMMHALTDQATQQGDAEEPAATVGKPKSITKLFVTDPRTADELKPSATAFVTFTSLRAKQTAVQCELSGKVDHLDSANAPIPNGILWKNVTVTTTMQRYLSMIAAAFWTVGALFWAVPVLFVTGKCGYLVSSMVQALSG